MKVKVLVNQSCLTLCDPMGYSPPDSCIHGIVQARILEWLDISFSRGSSQPRDQTQVSLTASRLFTIKATLGSHFLLPKDHPHMVMTSHGWPITLPSVPSPLLLQESLTWGGWQPKFWGKTHPLVPRCSGSRRNLESKTHDGWSISCQTWPSTPPACSMGLVGKDVARPWWTQPSRSTLPLWRQGSLLRWIQRSRSIFVPGFILFQDSTRHVRLMMADSMALLLLSRRLQLCRPEEYTGCYDDAPN